MPDPSGLPREVFQQILYDVIGGKPDQWPHIPCRAVTPLLYAYFEFDGRRKNMMSFWCFIFTILDNPELAIHVRHLTFTDQLKPSRRVADDIDKYCKLAPTFSEELAITGLDAVGFPQEHVEVGSHRPMFALLLLHCPRLASLHFHVPSQGPYLAAILLDAIVRRWEGQPSPKVALQHLRRLCVAIAEAKVEEPERRFWVQAPVYIEKEQPFFRLPKLEDF
ncbi:hypothetical protein BJX65DRAFT_305928 [Aspergillus insuetus]